MAYKFNPTTGKLDTVADPGGSDTQIQFNDGGVFGGDADLTYNKTTNLLTTKGDINFDDSGSFTTTIQTITPTANRTISFPNATGTLGLVGGSSGQVVYNNAGAYAGVSTMTFDGTSVTLAGRLINSYTSVASSPAKVFTGTWFTGGTATTTKPHFLIEPSGATSTAWSTSGTGLGVNAASGFAGRLLDLQLNGSSNFSVSSAGAATGASLSVTSSTVPANGVYLPAANEVGFATNTTYRGRFDASGRLLVGLTAARANFDNATGSAGFQLEGTDATSRRAAFISSVNSGEGGAVILAHQRSGTLGGNTILQVEDFLGNFQFQGSDGTEFVQGAYIGAVVDGSPGSNDMPTRLQFAVCTDGAALPTEALRITNDRVIAYNQPAPTSKSAAATLTVAELKTGIIEYTGAADTLTLPTGTLTEGGFSGIYTNMTFEWSVINTGSGTCTIGAGANHTIVGGATVAAGSSGRFASRRTAANTFVSYRLS